jgi:hypothetical protein
MPNFQKSKIYSLKCETTGLVYIGSTVQGLAQRLSEHRHRFKNEILQCSSRQVIENNNYKMHLLEKFPCENKQQLRVREQFHINNTPECVNEYSAYVTDEQRIATQKRAAKEWCLRNAEYLKDYRKEWHRKRREDEN